jgi:hypothetical protein
MRYGSLLLATAALCAAGSAFAETSADASGVTILRGASAPPPPASDPPVELTAPDPIQYPPVAYPYDFFYPPEFFLVLPRHIIRHGHNIIRRGHR